MRPIQITESPGLSRFQANFDGLRVLVAEDDWLVSMALQDMLTEMGCEVVGAASDAPGALSLVQEGHFDVAMLDYWLHDQSVSAIADVLIGKRIPVVLATGFGASDIAARLRHVPLLSKPYIERDVAEVLSHLIDRPMRMPSRNANEAGQLAEF